MPTLTGGCHCGNISLRFEGPTPVDALALRACQCSFCRKHGVRTTSDPNALLTIDARDRDAVARYTFGLHGAEFLVCRRCGVYVGAMLEHEHRRYATLNVNALDGDPFRDRTTAPTRYDDEDADARRQRRARIWTPTEVSF